MRKWIFRLHLYVGLSIGLLLAVIGVTGSLLVFADEWDEALNKNLTRVEPQGDRVSLQNVLDEARRDLPNGKPARIRMPQTPEGAYEVVINANAQPQAIYVDPYTGKVLGARPYERTLKRQLFSLHRRLFSGDAGETIVGIAGLLLFLLGISGVVLWFPKGGKLRRGFKINLRGGWRRASYDLHRVFGVVILLFLCTSAITGAYMVFHDALDPVINHLTSSPPRPSRPVSNAAAGVRSLSLDSVLRKADEALPGAKTTFIQFPATAKAPLTVRKKFPAEMHPAGRSLVHFDQYSGEVLSVENALQAPPGTRIANAIYPIHTGRLGRVWTRVLQVVVGFAPAVLFVTGFLMWCNRIAKRRRLPASSRASNKTAVESDIEPAREPLSL